MFQNSGLNMILVPLSYFIASLLVGVIAEYVVLRLLIRAARKTKRDEDDVIFNGMRGLVLLWFTAGGIYLAVHHIVSIAQLTLVYTNRVIFSIFIFTAGILASRIIIGLMKLRQGEGSMSSSSSIVSNIVKIFIYVICSLVVLQKFGISVTPILTALGVGALAVALALQDTLSNLFSGLQIVASKQINLGDYVKLNTGEEGYVTDITWRNTIIHSLSENSVIVPNSKLATAILTNFSLPNEDVTVRIEAAVSFNSDLEQVERIAIEAGKEILSRIHPDAQCPEPTVRFNTFSDSSIILSVAIRANDFEEQFRIRHEFIKLLMKRFQENNIEIPFPVRQVVMKENLKR